MSTPVPSTVQVSTPVPPTVQVSTPVPPAVQVSTPVPPTVQVSTPVATSSNCDTPEVSRHAVLTYIYTSLDSGLNFLLCLPQCRVHYLETAFLLHWPHQQWEFCLLCQVEHKLFFVLLHIIAAEVGLWWCKSVSVFHCMYLCSPAVDLAMIALCPCPNRLTCQTISAPL